MRDVLKNPRLYYIAALTAAVLWAALVWGLQLPNSEKKLNTEIAQYKQAKKLITEILPLDSARLNYADPETASADFDYASAVQNAAAACAISAAKYKLSSGTITTSSGQKSQSANVSLDKVDIKTFAKFLSAIQLRWANLQCTKVTLKKKKGLPDTWDVDLRFNYYY